jgi:uncharacterized protein (TIGR03000 family)
MDGKTPEKLGTPKTDGGKSALPAPAIIVVSLPAEATLLVDGSATTSTAATRVFASPALEPGQDYFYTLKGEIVRDGQKVIATETVKVRAGEESRVKLEFPSDRLAQK